MDAGGAAHPSAGIPSARPPAPPGHPDSELPAATCSEGAGAVTVASPRLRAPQPGWPPLCRACLPPCPLASVRGQHASPQLSLPGHLPPGAAERAHTARAPRRPPPSPPQRPKRAPRASALRSARASARTAQLPTPGPGRQHARPPAGRLRLLHFQSSHVPFPSLSSSGSPRATPLHSAPGRAAPGTVPRSLPQLLAAQRPCSFGRPKSTRPPSALAPLPLVCTKPSPGPEWLGRLLG